MPTKEFDSCNFMKQTRHVMGYYGEPPEAYGYYGEAPEAYGYYGEAPQPYGYYGEAPRGVRLLR